jgi:hypothetical protein
MLSEKVLRPSYELTVKLTLSIENDSVFIMSLDNYLYACCSN